MNEPSNIDLSSSCIRQLYSFASDKDSTGQELSKTLLSNARAGKINVAGLIHGALPCRTLSVKESGDNIYFGYYRLFNDDDVLSCGF